MTLFEINEVNAFRRCIGSLGTIYAETAMDAKHGAAIWHSNPEIETTGFYDAKPVEIKATMDLSKVKKHHYEQRASANTILERLNNFKY